MIRSKFSYSDVLKDPSLEPLLPMWAHELSVCSKVPGGARPEPTSAVDFYDDLFGDYLEEHKDSPVDYKSGEYGAILVEVGTDNCHRYTITRGQSTLYEKIDSSDDFCIMSPISYAGKARKGKNARELFALVIELDSLTPDAIDRYIWEGLYRASAKDYLVPTYIVCSGTGIHLYWCFERPIPLYQRVYEQMTKIKRFLVPFVWNEKTSSRDVQVEPIVQPFRVVGSKTKSGKITVAFKTGGKYTIETWNRFFPKELQLNVYRKSTCSLAEAKEKFPVWYNGRIEKGLPRKHYQRNPAIYYDWLKKILDYARPGHRYFCLENLASLACQTDISEEQLLSDCKKLQAAFNKRDSNLFTDKDVECALKTFYDKEQNAWRRTVEFVSARCAIPLTRARRNKRPQAEHLKISRYILELKNPNGEWRKKPRTKPKQALVQEWRASHPGESQRACARDLGISRNTVSKHWG